MAFRKKAQYILAHSPDILVVPECEHPDKIIFPSKFKQPTDKLWFGNNQHKGLGVFSFCDFRFKVLDVYNENFRMMLHKQIQGKEKHPTQYMYRHQDKPYHLDYCFMSSVFCNKLSSVEIGKYKKWAICSDHTPLIVEFNF